ncbi:MAG TPA: hypothetical protein VJZ72_09315 [Candidatus Limnocylindrales bacterium]|nr:hypothetical protein [Candidatus Limnocylindrales bacterium]
MRRTVAGLIVAVLAASAMPVSADAATPPPYRINLFRAGDFVSQVNSRTCVGASIQMMVNIGGPDDRSRATQMRFWQLARDLGNSRFGGANARGWATALPVLDEGIYMVDSQPNLRQAVTRAARAIRLTSRPVGLLVWHGAHAWVMHGFEATADPIEDPAAKITAVFMSDPWYPRVSAAFGVSPRPNSKLSIAGLGDDFLPWKRRHRNPEKDGRYFLVLPFPDYLTQLGPGAWTSGGITW